MTGLPLLACSGTLDKVHRDALSECAVGAPRAPESPGEAGMREGWEPIGAAPEDRPGMTGEDRRIAARRD